MPTLTIQFPGLPPVAHVLREETTTIGRMKGSTIVVDDNSVSLMHAKITRSKEGEYFLKDLNSTNGTLLNGQTVREARLQNLDQICFADIIAQFHADVVAPVAPITPLTPAPPAKPTTTTASGSAPPPPAPRASQPIATSDTSKTRRPHSTAAKTGVTKLADRAVPILGAIAALLVVGIVVWKVVSGNRQSETVDNHPAAPSNQTVAKPNENPPKKGAAASAPANIKNAVKNAKKENAGVARLVTGLRDTSVDERRRAVRALHGMGDEAKEAEDALREALLDSDEEVQMWAAVTLVSVKSYDKKSIPILIRTVKHEDPNLRLVACLSLGVIPYEAVDKDRVVPILATAAANDDNEEVRKAAYTALTIIAPDIVAKANETNSNDAPK